MPHIILFLSVVKKFCPSRLMRLMRKLALRTLISVPDRTLALRESREILKSSLRPVTLKWISLLLEITIGRTVRLCGAMGVIIKLSESGMMIGPPQLNEYAVEPVGVETINPSAK